MKLFIGEKKTFGIDLLIESQNQSGMYLGYAKLWFNNISLGSGEDLVYLNGYISKELDRMLSVKEIRDQNFAKESAYRQYNIFKKRLTNIHDKEIDEFKYNFGTMSDDFLIWAYRYQQHILVLWKLESSITSIQFSDLKQFPRKIFFAKVLYTEFLLTVSLIKKILSLPNLLKSNS